MQLLKATRKQAKIKLGIQGCSGSGKTIGGLLIAYGLCGDWNKVAVVDTEHYSASLYAHLGDFSVVNISAPFTPEKYIEAIKLCEKSGIEVIIIDSVSQEWASAGGILDVHANMAGNSFTNWSKLTPRHNAFIEAILQSPVHIISTIRSKQEYVLTEKNGKQVPEKVGLKGITRDDLDYEFTIMLDIDIKHQAISTKDRTGLFMDKPAFKITSDTGKLIANWCLQGIAEPNEPLSGDFTARINACKSLAELLQLYQSTSLPEKQQFKQQFSTHRKMLENSIEKSTSIIHQNHSLNGTSTPIITG